jgi:hypothetical protein
MVRTTHSPTVTHHNEEPTFHTNIYILFGINNTRSSRQIKRSQLEGDWRTNKKDRLSIM